MSQLMDTGDAANYLGLGKSTLEKLRCRGGGPRFAMLGRRARYRQEDLDTWVEARIVRVSAEARNNR